MKGRVLIVDDSPAMLVSLRQTLVAAGCEEGRIVAASGGTEAKRLLKAEGPFEAVFCDWNMPDLDGLELMRWLRSEIGDAATPFYVITAEDKDEQLALLLRSGATGYLCKPIHAGDIGALLN